MLGIGLKLKTTALSVIFLWLVEYLKKLVNNKPVDRLKKYATSLIFNMCFQVFQIN